MNDGIAGTARLLSFYLPQFHPTQENDGWWGRGFTEWTNVIGAKPLFEGHYQPHLPAHLGFYDLRVPEVRAAQADLAQKYGIEGFCYWHYWFHGRRLLHRPLDEVLSSGEPRFPFCLAWANETWSRRWLGEERNILLKQTYSLDDDRGHAIWLSKVFADPRYVRLRGRPLLLVYRPADLPDSKRTTEILREQCIRVGLEDPYLLGVNGHCPDKDCRSLGFDGTIEFEPQLGVLPGFKEEGLRIYDYVIARRAMRKAGKSYPGYPCIFVGWDNTPRRGDNGIVFINSSPNSFEAGLREYVRAASDKSFEERLIFINAWNEWAEGNHLEPDSKYGLAYLESVKRVQLGD